MSSIYETKTSCIELMQHKSVPLQQSFDKLRMTTQVLRCICSIMIRMMNGASQQMFNRHSVAGYIIIIRISYELKPIKVISSLISEISVYLM
jgi:hypothetical protein